MNSNVAVAVAASESKDWTEYSTGIAWGTVVLCFVTIFGYVGMLAGLASDVVSLPVGMVLATVLIYLGFTVAHEAGHGNIAHEVSWMKPYERLMGWAMTLFFLILPFGLFARIHDYHHAFTNDPDRDPDHWVSGNSWVEAGVRAATLPLHYVYITLKKFKHDPVIAQTHKASVVYYALTFSLMIGILASGYWLELLMIGIIPIFLASFVLGMLFDWIPHMPTRNQGRYQNTRSYLFPGLKQLTLGQNYHHIHHLYPRVSWYHYDKVFDVIRPELEAKNAPIEVLFSKDYPGFGQSPYLQAPSDVTGVNKFTLRVERLVHETADSVAITFENLHGKALPFKAGQYVTVTKLIDSEPVTRCYSICESPQVNKLTIGVKQVPGGVLSAYLNNILKEGDELTVAGPYGDFIYDPEQVIEDETLTLIAGGSGITPILSIAKLALEASASRVHLIYANKSIGRTMFLRQLHDLNREYFGRFKVTYIYETEHRGWKGCTGYLTPELLEDLLQEESGALAGRFYLCGPQVMKDLVVNKLNSLGVGNHRVFVENFAVDAAAPEGERHKVSVRLANGACHELEVAENQTVLQAANQKNVKIPHACGVGQCGCCMMQVVEGQSELAMASPPGLLPGELARGLTLACQCRPKTALLLQEGDQHD